MPVVDGILLGLIISVLVGPVFLLLIQTSITYGFRAALVLEIGIVASDITYILLASYGIGKFMTNAAFQYWMGMLGGLVVMSFGVFTLFSKKNPLNEQPKLLKTRSAFGLIAKSFVLNVTNPSVVIFWFTTVALAFSKYSGDKVQVSWHFAACVFTVFIIDLIKAYFAKKARNVLQPGAYKYVKYTTGFLLVLFGILILYKTFLPHDFS